MAAVRDGKKGVRRPQNGGRVFTFAREDDYFFGVLHSRTHELWALRMGTSLPKRCARSLKVRPARSSRRRAVTASSPCTYWRSPHPSTSFFVYRTPSWRGRRIEFDASGQRLNGVINVGYTVNTDYPVWSPIDTGQYELYMRGYRVVEVSNALAMQILDLLYTVRNNAFHGGKRADDANDHEVVERALPLLVSVVEAFLR